MLNLDWNTDWLSFDFLGVNSYELGSLADSTLLKKRALLTLTGCVVVELNELRDDSDFWLRFCFGVAIGWLLLKLGCFLLLKIDSFEEPILLVRHWVLKFSLDLPLRDSSDKLLAYLTANSALLLYVEIICFNLLLKPWLLGCHFIWKVNCLAWLFI